MANLINSGIIPLTFNNEDDYGKISEGDVLLLDNIRENIKEGKPIVLKNKTKNISIPLEVVLSERQRNIILEGGLLNYTKKQSEGK